MPTRTKYRYTLDKTSKKFFCPQCGKRRFVRYWDTLDNHYLPFEFGRCDRQESCGYFKKPLYQKSHYLKTNAEKEHFYPSVHSLKSPDYHPWSLLETSQKDIYQNQLILFLQSRFGEPVNKIIKKYYLGHASFWYGGTIFWQVDENKKIHAGKIIRYDKTGHRFGYPNWVHSHLKRKKVIKDFNLKQCLFGLHLLNEKEEKSKTISVVESEKTAIVMSHIFPENLWLATGGVATNRMMFSALRGRKIILYPDAGISNKKSLHFKNGKT